MKPIVVPLAAAMILAGCAQHRVVVPDPDLTGQPVTVQSDSLGWFAKQERTVPQQECPTNSIHEVRIKQNLLHAFVSLLTLGLWMPTVLVVQCGKNPTEEGNTDDGKRR